MLREVDSRDFVFAVCIAVCTYRHFRKLGTEVKLGTLLQNSRASLTQKYLGRIKRNRKWKLAIFGGRRLCSTSWASNQTSYSYLPLLLRTYILHHHITSVFCHFYIIYSTIQITLYTLHEKKQETMVACTVIGW